MRYYNSKVGRVGGVGGVGGASQKETSSGDRPHSRLDHTVSYGRLDSKPKNTRSSPFIQGRLDF